MSEIKCFGRVVLRELEIVDVTLSGALQVLIESS
jgi:hypothetical protein